MDAIQTGKRTIPGLAFEITKNILIGDHYYTVVLHSI